MIFVRRVRADEWEALHDLRLRALTDAPEAFSTTLAEAERRSEAEWQAAAERGARGDRPCTFVADDANRLVGMVTVYRPDPAAVPEAFPSLIQMWGRSRRPSIGCGYSACPSGAGVGDRARRICRPPSGERERSVADRLLRGSRLPRHRPPRAALP